MTGKPSEFSSGWLLHSVPENPSLLMLLPVLQIAQQIWPNIVSAWKGVMKLERSRSVIRNSRINYLPIGRMAAIPA